MLELRKFWVDNFQVAGAGEGGKLVEMKSGAMREREERGRGGEIKCEWISYFTTRDHEIFFFLSSTLKSRVSLESQVKSSSFSPFSSIVTITLKQKPP